jgi:hypothetical protein
MQYSMHCYDELFKKVQIISFMNVQAYLLLRMRSSLIRHQAKGAVHARWSQQVCVCINSEIVAEEIDIFLPYI